MRADIKNRDTVQRILSHDSVFFSASDDGIKNEGDLSSAILSDPRYICLLPDENALFLFAPVNHITYEMHVAIIEGAARKKGRNYAVESARWIFKNTPCRKIITYIPDYHQRSIMYAKVCGMEEQCRISDSFLKEGKLHGMVLLSAGKDKFIQLHGEV